MYSQFYVLYLCCCSFSHYPKLVTAGEGWNVDRLVNTELCPLAQLSSLHNVPVPCHQYRRCRKAPVGIFNRAFTLSLIFSRSSDKCVVGCKHAPAVIRCTEIIPELLANPQLVLTAHRAAKPVERIQDKLSI